MCHVCGPDRRPHNFALCESTGLCEARKAPPLCARARALARLPRRDERAGGLPSMGTGSCPVPCATRSWYEGPRKAAAAAALARTCTRTDPLPTQGCARRSDHSTASTRGIREAAVRVAAGYPSMGTGSCPPPCATRNWCGCL
eukprot:5073138-Prymnesium_polylepis.1